MIACIVLPTADLEGHQLLCDALAAIAERRLAQGAALFLDLGPAAAHDPRLALRALGRTARSASGQEPRVGLGPNPFVARLAAGLARPGHGRVVPAEGVARVLSPLPIALLPLAPDQQAHLERLGLTTLGALAALSARALAAQLGPDGRRLHQLAGGVDPTPIPRAAPPATIGLRRSFEPPVADRRILAAVLGGLAQAFARRLQARGQAGQRVSLHLVGAEGAVWAAGTTLSEPTTAADQLLPALEALLRRAELPAVATLTVRLGGLTALRAVQRDLSLDGPPRLDRAPGALADLTRRFGAQTFARITPASRTSHLPEARYVAAVLPGMTRFWPGARPIARGMRDA